MENNKGIMKMFSQTAHSLVATISELVKKGVTVAEIVEMVRNHQDTVKKSKTMLGITFDFYKLTLKDLSFHLEVRKGVVDKILSFKIYTLNHLVLNYRSYEEGLTLEDKIRSDHLPEITKQHI